MQRYFRYNGCFLAVASLWSSVKVGWRFFYRCCLFDKFHYNHPHCTACFERIMSRIKGILFDLGDTLLDFGPVDTLKLFAEGARQAYAYLQELGQPVPAFAKFHRRQLRAVQWHLLKSHITRRDFNSLDVLGRTSRAMGHDLSPEQVEELAWLWYEPLSRCVTVEDCTVEMLEGFRRDDLSLAVVSNTFVPGPVLDRHMDQLGRHGRSPQIQNLT